MKFSLSLCLKHCFSYFFLLAFALWSIMLWHLISKRLVWFWVWFVDHYFSVQFPDRHLFGYLKISWSLWRPFICIPVDARILRFMHLCSGFVRSLTSMDVHERPITWLIFIQDQPRPCTFLAVRTVRSHSFMLRHAERNCLRRVAWTHINAIGILLNEILLLLFKILQD